jgi:gluconate/galactonate dehydratase
VASPVGTIAACHVCAAVPNFLVLEHHSLHVPYWGDLVIGEKLIIRDGAITLSDAPGLGAALDDAVARRYLHTPMSDCYFAD